jgi:hypothetical protein
MNTDVMAFTGMCLSASITGLLALWLMRGGRKGGEQ